MDNVSELAESDGKGTCVMNVSLVSDEAGRENGAGEQRNSALFEQIVDLIVCTAGRHHHLQAPLFLLHCTILCRIRTVHKRCVKV